MGCGGAQREGGDEGRELWGGLRAWGMGPKPGAVRGMCGRAFRGAVCQGDLRAPEAVRRCWGCLEAVGVEFVGSLWGIEGRWELFLSKGLGGSGDVEVWMCLGRSQVGFGDCEGVGKNKIR